MRMYKRAIQAAAAAAATTATATGAGAGVLELFWSVQRDLKQ